VKKFRVFDCNQVMNYLLYGLSSAASMAFNYFQTKQMCEDNTREILLMGYVNFIMSVTVLLVMIFKKPIKVIGHEDLT
jgi:hypothetical protein